MGVKVINPLDCDDLTEFLIEELVKIPHSIIRHLSRSVGDRIGRVIQTGDVTPSTC